MLISEEALALRYRYKATGFKIIGARRPKDLSAGGLLIRGDTWILNHRIDVLSVGPQVKEDIVPGDVIFVTPRGDSRKILKLTDPEIESTWCGRDEDLLTWTAGTEEDPGSHWTLERDPWQKVKAIYKSESCTDRSTGEECRSVVLDADWSYISGKNVETMAYAGDYHVLPLVSKHRRFVPKEDFDSLYLRSSNVQA